MQGNLNEHALTSIGPKNPKSRLRNFSDADAVTPQSHVHNLCPGGQPAHFDVLKNDMNTTSWISKKPFSATGSFVITFLTLYTSTSRVPG